MPTATTSNTNSIVMALNVYEFIYEYITPILV